jgi:uncharacterized membrane protein
VKGQIELIPAKALLVQRAENIPRCGIQAITMKTKHSNIAFTAFEITEFLRLPYKQLFHKLLRAIE